MLLPDLLGAVQVPTHFGRFPVRQLCRFGLVGGGATLMYLTAAVLLVRLFDLEATVAAVISGCLATLVSYFGHHVFTFQVDAEHRFYAPRFAVVAVVSYVVNGGLVYLLVHRIGVGALPAFCATIVVVPTVNYFMNRYLVFGRGLERPAAKADPHPGLERSR